MPNGVSPKIRFFTDLIAWQHAHELVMSIYKITKHFPRDEQFGLSSQIRRAAVSVTANIAEGFARPSYKEKIQFYFIAQSSLAETQNHLIIGHDLSYIENEIFHKIYKESQEVSKILQALIQKSKSHF